MGISGKKTVTLNIENILARIDSYQIFKNYVPLKVWSLNRAFCSPLRKENNPSFLISNRANDYLFVDLATGDKGDCFTFVKKLYGLNNMHEVLEKIDRDFGLNISSGGTSTRPPLLIPTHNKEEEEKEEKKYSFIQVIPKKFTTEELQYWNSYYQDISDLKKENIFSINKIYLNRQLYTINSNELRFAYYYPGFGWKIYFPFAKDKRNKWLSNIPLNLPGGLDNLDKDKNTLITKSKKDYMVCRKIYPNVCYVQNESLLSFSSETTSFIQENSKEIFCGFDSDSAGKKASLIVTKALGYKHINPEDRLLPQTKDFSDWAKLEGLPVLEKHFKNKKLII